MKICVGFSPVLLALCAINVEAFAPVGLTAVGRKPSACGFSPMDPSNLQEIPHHIQSLQDAMSTFTIADLDPSAIADASAVAQSVDPAAVTEAAATNNGWFGFLTGPTVAFLQLIHAGLVSVGLGNSWGVSIIVLTLTIKAATFPLQKQQLESTQKMQVLQPTLKAVQAKYQSNPEVMNKKIAELYQTNGVNPLAGCLPAIVQLPVFVGLYRAVLELANSNALDESFLWLPSLEGPTYGAGPSEGTAWLVSNWANGAPSLGWEQTAAFLVLPVALVVSQFLSLEIMNTKEQKEQQPAFLKFLPLLIGYFSLTVPSALSVYWITNNIVTTATTLLIKNNLKMEPATVGAPIDAQSSPVPEPNINAFTPPPIREKPEGFGSSSSSVSSATDVTPITSSGDAIDAEVVSESVASSTSSKKKRGGKKKKKRRKN